MDSLDFFLENDLLARFLRYTRIDTRSCRNSKEKPSSPGQLEFAALLEKELRALGIEDIYRDEKGFVIGRMAANTEEDLPAVGLMAHLDTAPEESGQNVQARLHKDYDGGDIVLEDGIVLSPAEYPELADYKGCTVITADGTTLLGADDKAGAAEIMSAAAYLYEHPEIEHGPVDFIFTPDEETGTGMDCFPLSELRARCCYTVDGDEEAAIEAECFNAYKANVRIEGRSIHPGAARGKMANAVMIAGTFLSMLPRSESPEATDGRYGFYCPIEVTGSIGKAEIELIIRDFDIQEVERRAAYLGDLAKTVEGAYPGSRVSVETEKQYLNMKEVLDRYPELVEKLTAAVRAAGMDVRLKEIRGGTDGARLTEMGLPAPNIFTGGHNYHGKYEWIALPSMVKAARTLINLLRLWAE